MQGHGPTLLAMVPRVCAIFIDVNDKPACPEHFCVPSAREARKATKGHQGKTSQESDELPNILEEALEGSFLTYLISRRQNDYNFIHLPLLASFQDCLFHTGVYGLTLVKVFCALISSMHQGRHKLGMRIYLLYDHSGFNYFPLDVNSNPCGTWYTDLPNSELKSPHPHPHALVMAGEPMAQGTCILDVPGNFRDLRQDFLDCKPPKEVYHPQGLSRSSALTQRLVFGVPGISIPGNCYNYRSPVLGKLDSLILNMRALSAGKWCLKKQTRSCPTLIINDNRRLCSSVYM